MWIPKWSFKRVRESMDKRKQEGVTKKTTVTIPYVKGVSEVPSQVFCYHSVATAMKPLLTFKRILVHLKNKRTPQENA